MICATIASRTGSGFVVAAERVLHHVHQAAVAVGAGLVGTVLAAREHLDQVVVGDQRPRRADGVAVTALDRRRQSPSAVWKPPVQITGTVTAGLDRARVGQVLAFDLVRPGPLPGSSARAGSWPETPWKSRKLANVRSPLEIIVS